MSQSPFHGIFSAFDTSDTPVESFNTASPIAPVPEETSVRVAKSQTGQIAVDIFEQDNYYIIRAPIAGVKMSDLDIEVDGKVITIKGIRRANEEIDENQFYLKECFWGEFSRSITLPISIDPKKVKATYSKDSILKVLVAKEEKVKIVRVSEG